MAGLPRPNLETGTLVGQKYRVEGRIGAGGMSEVYRVSLVRHPGLEFALKVMSPDPHFASELEGRFRREFDVLRNIEHPGIVRMHEYLEFVHRGQRLQGIVMDLIDGENLDQRLQRAGPMAAAESVAVMHEVLSALDAAHQTGLVIHRDLKPSNILLDRQGRAHLCDFGIARRMQSRSRLTRYGKAPGTPQYMSPEQILLPPDQLDHRSDVYSAGIVLYEMLTGRVPFDDENDNEDKIKIRQVQQMPADPRIHNPGLGPELTAALMKALSKERSQRYAGALEFDAALQASLQQHKLTDPGGKAPGTLPPDGGAAHRRFAIFVRADGSYETIPVGPAPWWALPFSFLWYPLHGLVWPGVLSFAVAIAMLFAWGGEASNEWLFVLTSGYLLIGVFTVWRGNVMRANRLRAQHFESRWEVSARDMREAEDSVLGGDGHSRS